MTTEWFIKDGSMLSTHTEDPHIAIPIPMNLNCPSCGIIHVDTLDAITGIDWAIRPHKTHLCLHCGMLFKPYNYATVGVMQTTTTLV